MPTSGDIVRAVLKGKLLSSIETRSMFTVKVDLGDGVNPTAWSTYFESIISPLEDWISSSWAAYAYDLYEMDTPVNPATGPTWTLLDEVAWSRAGNNLTDELLPLQVAAVLIAKTVAKRGMGRKFLPGFVETSQASGVLVANAIVSMGSALVAYLAPVAYSVTDRYYPGIVRKDGSFFPFVGGVADTILGSQRRRKQGVGI